jgi:DNA-binding CsgD family transcriptional regulator
VRVVTTRVSGATLRVELLFEGHKAMPLTGRQAQVAACVAKGMRNAQIADELGISLHTVRRHLEQMFRRLGVNNRRDALKALQRLALD